MIEGKIIIVPKARPAVDFASNLLVIPKDDVDEYVKEISRTIEQCFEDDLWIKTARLNTTYIPTWNNKNGDFSEISPFLFFGVKKNVVKVLYINA